MKKSIVIAMTTLMLAACGGDKSTDTKTENAVNVAAPKTNQQEKAEHYSVGAYTASPPFIYTDEKGAIIGFDVDILQAIADDQNFSFDPFPSEFDELFNSLNEDKYQLLVANLAITSERQEKYQMSKPYLFVPNVIMGKEASGHTAKTLAEIGEQKVAVVDQSLSHQALQKAGIKNIVPTPSAYSAYASFVRGEVDYVVGDVGVLTHHHLSSSVADKVKIYTSAYDQSEEANVGFAIAKNNTVLAHKIDKGLANIHANGKYDEIYKKWFGDDQSLRVSKDKL